LLSIIILSFWRLTPSPIRLQVDAISRLSSFVLEKQESDAVKKALNEARGRNEDLIRRNEDLLDRNDDLITKMEDSARTVTQLQETVQRYSFRIIQLY
jgi:myosin-5